MDALDSRLSSALRSVQDLLRPATPRPQVGVVCGSGLGGLAEQLADAQWVPYRLIDRWPKPPQAAVVRGHEAHGLVFGRLSGAPVVCQAARLHRYEGYAMADVVFGVRLFKLLGCEAVILTNAAGAVNPAVPVGQIMALCDHVSLPSLTAWNPLIGPNVDGLGPRFLPMSDAYDFEMRKSVFRALPVIGLKPGDVREGIYAWVSGPTYETRAEGRFIRSMGADVVGMSTVPEVIAARHVGLRVLVLSLVTNVVIDTPYQSAQEYVAKEQMLSGDSSLPPVVPTWKEETANHEEVLKVGEQKAQDVLKLVDYVVNDPTWRSRQS